MKVRQRENPVPSDSKALDAERLETLGDCAADAPKAGNQGRRALEVATMLCKLLARPHRALPEEPASPREKEAEDRFGDDWTVE